MEDQIKSLQQETLYLTQRVIALENYIDNNPIPSQKYITDLEDRITFLKGRIEVLENARQIQKQLNQDFINDIKSTRQEKKPWWPF